MTTAYSDRVAVPRVGVRHAAAARVPLLLAAAALVIVYAATRLVFIAHFPYFLDEGIYAEFTYKASHSIHQLFDTLTIGREPLQIWLGIPFVKLGFNPLIAVRLVSFGCGLLTIVPVTLVARRLGGTPVALAAAVLCVLLPFLFVHDGIGITEPVVTLIMATALLLSIELARRPGLRLGAALGIVLGAGVLTKQNTLPAAVLAPVGLICFDWSREERARRLKLWLAGIVLAALGLLAGELVLRSSSLYPVYRQQQSTGLYTVRKLHTVLAHPFATWGKTWSVYLAAFRGYVTLPLLALAAVGAALGLRGPRRLALVLLIWLAFGFLVSMLFTAFPFPRHVMYLMPPAIVFMAYGFVVGAQWVRGRLSGPASTAVVALAAVLLLTPALLLDGRVLAQPATAHYPGRDYWQYVTGTGAGAEWPKLADAIRRYGAGRRRVVILHPTADTTITQLLLGDNRKYVFVAGSSPLASHAQLAVTDEIPFVDPASFSYMKQGHPVRIVSFARPRGGPSVHLFELQRNQ